MWGCLKTIQNHSRRFPEIGVPPIFIHILMGFSYYKPSILGYPEPPKKLYLVRWTMRYRDALDSTVVPTSRGHQGHVQRHAFGRAVWCDLVRETIGKHRKAVVQFPRSTFCCLFFGEVSYIFFTMPGIVGSNLATWFRSCVPQVIIVTVNYRLGILGAETSGGCRTGAVILTDAMIG